MFCGLVFVSDPINEVMANIFCFRQTTSSGQWHVRLMALYLHRPGQKESFQKAVILEVIYEKEIELCMHVCRRERGKLRQIS